MNNLYESLREENPKESRVLLEIFADALQIYLEATANVKTNGAIVSHPRTGAPIENPYLKIQTQKGAVLASMARIRTEQTLSRRE